MRNEDVVKGLEMGYKSTLNTFQVKMVNSIPILLVLHSE